MKSLLIALSLTLTMANLQANTLVVSDVDDTIKMTDVLGRKTQVVLNGLFSEKAFSGMSELYRLMSNDETTFYYVSGSPKIIKSRIHEFLEENQFPQRYNVVLKNSLSDDTFEYKTSAIRSLIKKLNPSKVILIGDDTEYDPEVYEQISREYPSLVKAIHIRAVKNREIVGHSFFSAVEIAAFEILAGRLSLEALAPVTYGFVNQTNQSGIYLEDRYCPIFGRESIKEFKKLLSQKEASYLLNATQEKIVNTCN